MFRTQKLLILFFIKINILDTRSSQIKIGSVDLSQSMCVLCFICSQFINIFR